MQKHVTGAGKDMDLACRLEEAAIANSAGDVHREEDRATRAKARGRERVGVSDVARADLGRSRKQTAGLHRITGDAQDRRPLFRELAGNLQPGSAGAADNAVGESSCRCCPTFRADPRRGTNHGHWVSWVKRRDARILNEE